MADYTYFLPLLAMQFFGKRKTPSSLDEAEFDLLARFAFEWGVNKFLRDSMLIREIMPVQTYPKTKIFDVAPPQGHIIIEAGFGRPAWKRLLPGEERQTPSSWVYYDNKIQVFSDEKWKGFPEGMYLISPVCPLDCCTLQDSIVAEYRDIILNAILSYYATAPARSWRAISAQDVQEKYWNGIKNIHNQFGFGRDHVPVHTNQTIPGLFFNRAKKTYVHGREWFPRGTACDNGASSG